MSQKLNLTNVTPGVLGRGSVKGEETIIQHIFNCIGTTNKYCVEFGAEGYDGYHQSSTHYLRYNQGWDGIMFDAVLDIPSSNIHREFFTKENICSRFNNWNVPREFDYLAIDVDGNDFWLLSALLKEYSPRVIMAETNVRFQPNDRYVLKYNPNFYYRVGITKGWYGCSPRVMKELGEKYEYTAVCLVWDNIFLIKNKDLHTDDINIPWEKVYNSAMPEIYNDHQDFIKNDNIWLNLENNPLPE